MITVRRSEERGHASYDWLDTYHTFSFDTYYDAQWMGFRALRVINEDRVAAGAGFPTHPHRDMEILTWVLEGALEHRDSMGNGSVIRPGELQRMSAGTGITHSEANPSAEEPVHLLQIWILPEKKGLKPEYEQTAFPGPELRGRLRLVASPDGQEGSLTIHQDAMLRVGRLAPGEVLAQAMDPARYGWLQVARGAVNLNGQPLRQGDGAAVSQEARLEIEGVEPAEILLFDLA